MAETTLPRWMQGDWAGQAPLLAPRVATPARRRASLPPTLAALMPAAQPQPPLPAPSIRIRRRPARPTRGRTRGWLFGGGLAMGLAGTQVLAIPERELPASVEQPAAAPATASTALPFADPLAPDTAPPPPPLTPEEAEAVRAAIGVGAYSGPAPAGLPFRAASLADRERALTCMTQAIYYEAGLEPEAGQRAVAQVVLNRARHPDYPNSVCGVVYHGCQFSFTCDGALLRPPAPAIWARARRYAEEALAGRSFAGVGYSTHYHTVDIWPYWASVLPVSTTIGRHIFHVMPGAGGAPGAFRARYAGREPAPRPYTPRPAAPRADPRLAAIMAEAVRAAASDRLPPAPAERAGPAVADNLPQSRIREDRLPQSQVRPEFENSGRWIGG